MVRFLEQQCPPMVAEEGLHRAVAHHPAILAEQLAAALGNLSSVVMSKRAQHRSRRHNMPAQSNCKLSHRLQWLAPYRLRNHNM